MLHKTKIVATIGPASSSLEVLGELMAAGMNVARLNFSHGTHEEHGEMIRRIREVAVRKSLPIAILQDLPGPKIRIGRIKDGTVQLQTGQEFVLTVDDVPGTSELVSVSYDSLPEAVSEGDRILLADGAIELVVLATDARTVTCKVIVGGELSSRKGINLPRTSLRIKAFTAKDREDLEFGLKQGIDYVALSFVRTKQDVLEIKDVIKELGADTPLIAKIEKNQAVDNLDEIIEVVDGVMVARGDLAVETDLEQVPIVQKRIIRQCNKAGKPVITATQMLKSMVESPRPTRAEANDVANAVLDGTDAVMLSEETTVGQYPVAAVSTMRKIIEVTEREMMKDLQRFRQLQKSENTLSIQEAVSRGAFEIARDVGAAAIITPTDSGSTARMISSNRPSRLIIAFSPNEGVVRRLNLVWGVYPILSKSYTNSDEMIEHAKEVVLQTGLVKKGDKVVITAGIPVGVPGTTNLIQVDIL